MKHCWKQNLQVVQHLYQTLTNQRETSMLRFNTPYLGVYEISGQYFCEKQVEISRKIGQPEISETQEIAAKLRETIQEIRKTAREKEIERRRVWVAEQVFKEIEEKGLDSTKNLLGVLIIHLSTLRETVGYLTETKAQTPLESFPEKILEEEHILRRTNRYRYTIQRLPDRWEVRAILNTPASSWNLEELRNQLSTYGVSIEEVPKDRSLRSFELYSRDMYIQVFGQENQVEISIRTPATEDAKIRVSNIIETIISTLTK